MAGVAHQILSASVSHRLVEAVGDGSMWLSGIVTQPRSSPSEVAPCELAVEPDGGASASMSGVVWFMFEGHRGVTACA